MAVEGSSIVNAMLQTMHNIEPSFNYELFLSHSACLVFHKSEQSIFRGGTKSPWSRRKRKRPLSCRHWNHLFSSDGKLRDGGRKFLKKVRGGVSPVVIPGYICTG